MTRDGAIPGVIGLGQAKSISPTRPRPRPNAGCGGTVRAIGAAKLRATATPSKSRRPRTVHVQRPRAPPYQRAAARRRPTGRRPELEARMRRDRILSSASTSANERAAVSQSKYAARSAARAIKPARPRLLMPGVPLFRGITPAKIGWAHYPCESPS